MFRKAFDWLDKKLGKSGNRWKNILDFTPFLLVETQIALVVGLPVKYPNISNSVLLLLNTPLAIIAVYYYPIKHIAIKKYKIWVTWARGFPIFVLTVYAVQLIWTIKLLLDSK